MTAPNRAEDVRPQTPRPDRYIERVPNGHRPTELPMGEPPPVAMPISRTARIGMRSLVTLIGVLLAGVIAAPIALSSQDLVAWAGAADGLGLIVPWDVLTFVALDAAAAVCVGMVVYAAWRGEPGGAFGVLVWAFAVASAAANYRHSIRPDAPGDAWWFFPAMSLAGPALLEVTVRRIRRWVQTTAGRYERPLPHFRLARWLVALPETAIAWRLAVTEGYSRPEDAIAAARTVRTGAAPATVGATPDTPPRSSSDTGSRSSLDTAQATPAATPGGVPATTRATVRQGLTRTTRRRPAPGSATARLVRVYGDGTDPATGKPWTSRPLAAAAKVHHATAANHLRRRRAQAGPAPDVPAPTDQPSTAAQPARPVTSPA